MSFIAFVDKKFLSFLAQLPLFLKQTFTFSHDMILNNAIFFLLLFHLCYENIQITNKTWNSTIPQVWNKTKSSPFLMSKSLILIGNFLNEYHLDSFCASLLYSEGKIHKKMYQCKTRMWQLLVFFISIAFSRCVEILLILALYNTNNIYNISNSVFEVFTWAFLYENSL